MSPKDIAVIPPAVAWAQTSRVVFLTFNLECDKPDIKIEKNSISFNGISSIDKKKYGVNITLYSDIDEEKSTISNVGRQVEVVLPKLAQDEPYWPTLTKEKVKYHWLKIDFNKWQDEEDSAEEVDDMSDMFSSNMGDLAIDNDVDDTSSVEDDDLPHAE